jgi:hypothetical protein
LKSEESVLKALLYFDMFNYPVTPAEIHMFMDQPLTRSELNATLEKLLSKGYIYQLDEFVSLQNNYSLVERRRKGNQLADLLIEKAKKISKRLYGFPYIRAIGVSGSVSKNFADEDADIDYFIITKTNRLWIARTILHLYKKIPFLKGRNKWYCMNYFVDEAYMQIEEKNIYTATELITLMPMHGAATMNKFFFANEWAVSYFPNFNFSDLGKKDQAISGWSKKITEFFFNNKPGAWLDNYFFRLTTKRWQLKEKQGRLNTKGESMGLKTSKHCSKPNPVFFHDQFLDKYEARLRELKKMWSL